MTAIEIEELCEELFRYRRTDAARLQAGGFSAVAGAYQKEVPLADSEFILLLRLTLDPKGHGQPSEQEGAVEQVEGTVEQIEGSTPRIDWQVVEADSRQPYELVRVNTAVGSYVSEIRTAVAEVLQEVAADCFTEYSGQGEQVKRIQAWIEERLAVRPACLWEKHPQFAVFRLETGKWFAISMEVERRRLGLSGGGQITVMNLKAKPADVEACLTKDGFLPAYHMNKRHWLSVLLDGRIADGEIQELIQSSYEMVRGRKKSGMMKAEGTKDEAVETDAF